MKGQVQKWGNSLAVRIPKAFAVDAGFSENSDIEISFERGRVILTPVVKPSYTIEELLAGMTAKHLHGETDTGPVMGNEVW